ncbi:hypothetical protein DYB31_003344, partial [Aphanomyces astaci]
MCALCHFIASGKILQRQTKTCNGHLRLHTFKFEPYVSLDVNLQAFDKMRTVVEKLEGRPLSDSHLASALLAALPDGGGRRIQGGPSGHRGGKRHGKGGGRGGGTGTSFLNTIRKGYASSGQQGYASSGPPGYAPSGHSGYASPDYGAYRDDQRGRSPFRQSASRYRSRSGDRYRDYREDRGYYCDDSGSYRDDRGSYRDDSGANQDDRHHRSRSRSAPLVDQGYAHQAS